MDFFWHFYQDGTIQLECKLTGLLLTTGVAKDRTASDVKNAQLICPGLSAPYHQHFFGIRLDTCVDGFFNSVYEVNVSGDNSPVNVQGNAFSPKKTQLVREFQAQRNMNLKSGRYWQFVNHNVRNLIGQPAGYRLVPGDNTLPFAHPSSPLMQRAGFIAKHLWVTQYHPEEQYHADMYPNRPAFNGTGLPNFTRLNRSLADTHLVAWYTLGVLHVPRLEEWPILPVLHASFSLMPDGFFDENPTMHLATHHKPDSSKESCNASGEQQPSRSKL